jgi:hypothetical protein
MHEGCQCNELRAIRNRNIGIAVDPTADGLRLLREQASRIQSHLPEVAPWEWGEMPATYAGAKRARYERAEADVLQAGCVSKKDAGVTMFVKAEKINATAKVDPDPRNIQFRDPKYCVAVARFLKPMEHILYELKGDGRYLPNSRLIGKGLGSHERAQLLERKMNGFDRPVVISLDASRFDKHVSLELLCIEHGFYHHMSGHDCELFELLNMQLVNHGRSMTGVKYVARGRRMSGDMNTALGNCLLMVLMVSTAMYGKKYDLLDDGDDCLLVVESELLEWCVEHLPPLFLTFGMKLKLEHTSYTLENVEWCQSHPVRTSDGLKFVRDPRKVLSTALIGVKYVAGAKDVGARAAYVNTIGTAELLLNLGVPVLQEYALALMRNSGTSTLIQWQDTDPLYYRVQRELHAHNLKVLKRVAPKPIGLGSRESFAEAFGVTIQEQLDAEAFLRDWAFPLEGDDYEPDWFDAVHWTASPYGRDAYGAL